jgi:hypothetical protein
MLPTRASGSNGVNTLIGTRAAWSFTTFVEQSIAKKQLILGIPVKKESSPHGQGAAICNYFSSGKVNVRLKLQPRIPPFESPTRHIKLECEKI